MRRFGTQGRVYPSKHYVVPRSEEIFDFLQRVKEGRYIVLFAPRQTGKTTFFRMALDTLVTDSSSFFQFNLPNFTHQQVQELLGQYTDETEQPFSPEVIAALHKQTAGQPFLVNRFAQILTEELEIPKNEMITMQHFSDGLAKILRERNTNIDHLITNIRGNRRFETLLMKITSYEKGIEFSLYNELISELATYGVIAEGVDGMCEIVNPIYQHCIM